MAATASFGSDHTGRITYNFGPINMSLVNVVVHSDGSITGDVVSGPQLSGRLTNNGRQISAAFIYSNGGQPNPIILNR